MCRVLSDASRIIRSNSLHFLALSLLFIFPVSLLNAVVPIQTLQHSSPLHSHYRRLLSTVSGNTSDPGIPPLEKSHLLFQFLYGLLLLAFNLCSAASVTHSAFHGFHGAKTQKLSLSSSLKSALSSFFPLLATRLVYLVIIVAVVFAFGLCIGFASLGLVLLGFEVEPSSKPFMAVALIAFVLLIVLLIHLSLKWFLIDPVVVAESKYGFEPFERSSKLVKGGRRAALLMMLFFTVLNGLLSGLYSANLAGGGAAAARCRGAVVLAAVAYAALSAALALFAVAAKTVLFIHCKAFNGEESAVPVYDKMGEAYVPLPVDDAGDQV